MKKIDLTGKVFGDLVVVGEVPSKVHESGYTDTQWLCECECGQRVVVRTSFLRRKKYPKTSCGCKSYTKPHGNRKGNDPSFASFRALIKRYRNTSRHRAIQWLLSEERAMELFTGTCFYCGISPCNTYNVYMTKEGTYRSLNKPWIDKATIKFNGIDRLNSAKAYVDGNVVSCCSVCNYAKLSLSLDEFYGWIERIAVHQGFSK